MVVFVLDIEDVWVVVFWNLLWVWCDWLVVGLMEIGFVVYDSYGMYFLCVDLCLLGYDDSIEFCVVLLEKVGVVVILMLVFCDFVVG